jgi:hypothetical protein
VKRRFDPLKKALLGDREDLLYARVSLALANLTHVHLLPAGCTSRLPESLDPSWSLLAVHGALIIVSLKLFGIRPDVSLQVYLPGLAAALVTFKRYSSIYCLGSFEFNLDFAFFCLTCTH